jgi:hypothetical protein
VLEFVRVKIFQIRRNIDSEQFYRSFLVNGILKENFWPVSVAWFVRSLYKRFVCFVLLLVFIALCPVEHIESSLVLGQRPMRCSYGVNLAVEAL